MDSPSSLSTTDKATFLFVTLGCAKNEVDTDRMRSQLLADGFVEAYDVENASVVLVNTCSFLASATTESIETTLELADAIAHGVRTRPLIMCGCVPSRYGSELKDELPEVSAFVKADEEDNIVKVVREVLNLGDSAIALGDGRMLRTIEGTSAYVKISDGCDRFCSFCAIPYIRGAYHSRPQDELVDEVRGLLAGGVREIVLIGQDTGVWGSDLPGHPTLASLLRALAQEVRPYHGWIRVLYLQPEGMTDELIAAIRDLDEVLPYIDIPIQHCSERVLRRMNRSGSMEELRKLFCRLRAEIDGMVLRTTGMAGFPGETDEEADELVEFLLEQQFDYTSVFAYSPEEGTQAAELDGQIDEATKLERTQRLMDIAEQMGFAATASHVGERVSVIIDGIEEGDAGPELIGHAWFQAPDCDGAVHIEEGEASVGDIVTCDLVDSFCYELIGVMVDETETDHEWSH
ncbi:MAG: 30S ribosomal protein S12 methylthiotransferase RimO [Atopobiaceae bacterium]|nr:30S ribosomal protein S12 methylthiotransferase RimO [Atopobiaceae bacterium]